MMHGKWQKLILGALKKRPAFYAADLLKPGYSRSEYIALLKAVSVLEPRGEIKVTRFSSWASSGRKVAVSRIGHEVDEYELAWSRKPR